MGRTDGRYLGEVERGFHSPTITTAKQIADALDVRLADLVLLNAPPGSAQALRPTFTIVGISG